MGWPEGKREKRKGGETKGVRGTAQWNYRNWSECVSELAGVPKWIFTQYLYVIVANLTTWREAPAITVYGSEKKR